MNRNKILTKLNIEALNHMQEDAYDSIQNEDRDVIVLSPTGSGKTLAYMLPLSEKIDAESDRLQAIVIVPKRIGITI